jgi:hypothetical protein
MEHEEHTDKLARELERLDEHSGEVGERIDEARREWEAKEDDPAVPGAQPEPGADESAGTPGDEGTATGNPDAAGSDEEDQAGA